MGRFFYVGINSPESHQADRDSDQLMDSWDQYASNTPTMTGNQLNLNSHNQHTSGLIGALHNNGNAAPDGQMGGSLEEAQAHRHAVPNTTQPEVSESPALINDSPRPKRPTLGNILYPCFDSLQPPSAADELDSHDRRVEASMICSICQDLNITSAAYQYLLVHPSQKSAQPLSVLDYLPISRT